MAPILALAAGCGTSGHGYALDVGSDDSGGAGPPGLGDVGGEAGASVLAVSIAPGARVLCSGQCADLSAQAVGGTGPYVYQWDHGLPAGAGPEHVCPIETTTYTVVATDSSGHGVGEFVGAPAKGSASVTLTVKLDCSEAGTPTTDANAGIEANVGIEASTVVDAGANLDVTGWSGCETLSQSPTGTQTPLHETACSSDGSPGATSAICLPQPLLAGQRYQMAVTFGGLVVVGTPPQFALSGATASCPSQMLGPSMVSCVENQPLIPQQSALIQQQMATSSVCITADADYPELLLRWITVPTQFTSGPTNLTIQVCTGCDQ
jgi:hypothetical protein